MIFTEPKLQGAFIIDMEQKPDSRGFFARTFCVNEFASHGLQIIQIILKICEESLK